VIEIKHLQVQLPRSPINVFEGFMGVIIPPSGQFKPYAFPDLSLQVRLLFGYVSTLPVKVSGELLLLDEHVFEYHDLLHYEVSLLERIRIGQDMVSGIHGICLPIFPNVPKQSEYDGVLDEARVAFHEFLTRPSVYNTFKLVNWFVWLFKNQMNPFSIMYLHYGTLRRFGRDTRKAAIYNIQSLESQRLRQS
jgi:hypothetical protein